jgi:hypothetical protein
MGIVCMHEDITLRNKPWTDVEETVKSDILLPKGFVTDEERQCYYYLAKYFVKGHGNIIDGGACLGSSAYCFGAGLAQNPSRGISRIHSYDRFIVSENYVADMISNHFRPLKQPWGDDFFDIFEYQTGKYRDLIVAHRGDFLAEKWDRSPIEILFVDIAKSKKLHDHVVEQFFPYLIPGKSLLLHQDYYFCWLPFIHIAMQYLSHRFEIVDRFIPSASRLYMLKDALTSSEIDNVQKLSREKRVELLDQWIDGETGDLKAMARVTKMCQLWYDKDEIAYADERRRLETEFGILPNTNWGMQCIQLDQLSFDNSPGELV